MARRTTKAVLILAAVVSMAAAVTMAAAGVAAAHPAGVAAAKPKPSPTPTPTPTPTRTSTAAYTVTNLGSLGGGYTKGLALNNNGQVTGYSTTGKTITLKTCCGGCYPGGPHNPCVEQIYHAFVWSNGTMTDLGNNFISAAVNDNDAVVWSDLIYSGGTVQNLNNLTPAGSPQIDYAVAINDKGQIVANAGGYALLLTPN